MRGNSCVSQAQMEGGKNRAAELGLLGEKSPGVLYLPLHARVYKPMKNLWPLVVVNHLGWNLRCWQLTSPLSVARGCFGRAVKVKGAGTWQLWALASELHFSKSKCKPLFAQIQETNASLSGLLEGWSLSLTTYGHLQNHHRSVYTGSAFPTPGPLKLLNWRGKAEGLGVLCPGNFFPCL